MKINVGNTDRIVRAILAMVLIMIIYVEFITGPFSWILGTIAIVFIATSLTGLCPVYSLLKINTLSKRSI